MTQEKKLVFHSKKKVEHGTPSNIVEIARELMGGIDLDPMSSKKFNTIVKALQIYTEIDNGLIAEWRGRVFVNPAGGSVKQAWIRLSSEYLVGNVLRGFFVGFSMSQLCHLNNVPNAVNDFSVCYLRQRLAFLDEESLLAQSSPPQYNFVVGVGTDVDKFNKLLSPLGRCFHGRLAIGQNK